MKKDIKFLDCSLRDGGYYNDWEFSLENAQSYIDAVHEAGVKIVEIGFRFTQKASFMGPFAYSREGFLDKLKVPEGLTLGVMINASDYLDENWKENLDDCFVDAKDSKADLVRIAAHMHQVHESGKLVEYFKNRGYTVGFNIMQISEARDETIRDLIQHIEENFCDFDALYFADSLGKMTPKDVARVITIFRENCTKELGFHGHDNMGMGVQNSLSAIEAGATWVDATVTGIGRGAGNTQTEYLLNALNQEHGMDFCTKHVNRVALGWLGEMKAECHWGTNILYYEAASRSIHPTYVQEMIASPRYSSLDVLNMIYALKDMPKPTSFKAENIDHAFAGRFGNHQGSSTVDNIFGGRPVILLGGSNSAKKHKDAIKEFAHQNAAKVISLNAPSAEFRDLVDAMASVHPARIEQIRHLGDFPMSWPILFTSIAGLGYTNPDHFGFNVVDFGFEVSDRFSVSRSGVTSPIPNILTYAIGLAQAGNASDIYLAGVDGLDGLSPEFVEINDFIKTYAPEVKSLTRTNFSMDVGGLYK